MGIRRAPVEDTLRQAGLRGDVLDAARVMADKQGIPVREAVRRVPGADPRAVAEALSKLSGLPLVDTVDDTLITPDLIRELPIGMSRDRGILPLYEVDGQIVVGLSDLSAVLLLDDLRLALGKPVRPVIVPADRLDQATNKAYDRAMASANAVLDDVEDELGGGGDDLNLDDADLLDDPDNAPIIRFVNALLTQAIKERASDIHIEPFEKDLLVRFRVDGVLSEAVRPPTAVKRAIVSRIKIMAGLNIAEKRLPQDGRIRRRFGGREIDLRVSTVPVRHGERVVMRILEKGTVFSLDKIGMPPDILEVFRKLINQPHGIVLVSGPTGSGKSTTLYSGITEINSPDKNILTIEDPVEYEVKGIGQVQVNHKIDLTFASALRAFLRQDPDVILVGEIRDRETAMRAVEASLTGHLVFSTIHTNDSAGAFARITEMGVEPFLVASSLTGVIAQRLVRRLCGECKAPYTPSDEELSDLELHRRDIAGHVVYKAMGCEKCSQKGYQGRIGIYELLVAHDDVKNLIIAKADAGAIKRAAAKHGMKFLRDDGVRKVLMGVTTFDEVLRVTQSESAETEG